jgi:hypothetical protein
MVSAGRRAARLVRAGTGPPPLSKASQKTVLVD